MPALDVPRAAPTAIWMKDTQILASRKERRLRTAEHHLRETKIDCEIAYCMNWNALTAAATPANPKNGAKGGQSDIAG
jgi:hypothetical protein